jgi:hypothetical protein
MLKCFASRAEVYVLSVAIGVCLMPHSAAKADSVQSSFTQGGTAALVCTPITGGVGADYILSTTDGGFIYSIATSVSHNGVTQPVNVPVLVPRRVYTSPPVDFPGGIPALPATLQGQAGRISLDGIGIYIIPPFSTNNCQ